MKLLDKLLRIAGKENFKIDNEIDISYIFLKCFKYALMKIRGFYGSMGYKKISSSIMIGKKVQLISKKRMVIGNKTRIEDYVKIDAMSKDGVKLGDNVVIGEKSIIECTGSIRSIGKGIKIGNGSTFGRDCFFGAAGGIEIGNDVIGGQCIRFHSENHKYDNPEKLIKDQGVTHKGIVIGNNSWIGAGVIFLDGAKIGNGCIIAANTVVNKQFGDNLIIGGIPGKVIKNRFDE